MVKKKWVALLISALGIALVLGALERASANRLVTGTSFVMDTVVQYSFYGKHAQEAIPDRTRAVHRSSGR